MASRGMKLEDVFRAQYSLKKEDDLFQLIEAAIMVAVFEKKAEFCKRKARIAEILNSERPEDAVFSTSEDSDDDDDGELPHVTPPLVVAAVDANNHRSVTSGECGRANPDRGFQENKKYEKVVRENNNNNNNNNNRRHGIQEKQRPKDAGKNLKRKGTDIDEQKFKTSEKRLEQRYRDLEKRKRKVQLLDIKDAPKLEISDRIAKKTRF